MRYITAGFFAILFASIPSSFVSAHGTVMESMMGSGSHGIWWSWIGGVTMLLLWTFLILGIATFWKSLNSKKK